jgi:predicted helicase
LVIDADLQALKNRIQQFFDLEIENIKTTLNLRENKTWKIAAVRNNTSLDFSHIRTVSYRPFDSRHIYFDTKFIERARLDVMQHMLNGNNLGLNLCRQVKAFELSQHFFISDSISESCLVSNKTSEIGSVFPLYLYPEDNSERIPNLNPDEIKAFEKALDLPFKAENPEKTFVPTCLLSSKPTEFTPIDILDYIYAVLHSPSYRETYKEFLKTDFPRVPYPTPETFWQLVALGDEIRLLHLMESPTLDQPITAYPKSGDNIVTRKISKTSPGWEAVSDTHGKVWINDCQYFDKVPVLAWNFYIGGYQPAQKWLKDRQGRVLSFDDIMHYQKIIVALTETDRFMHAIDAILYPQEE